VYREAAVYQAGLYLRRGDETEGYLPEEVWADNNPDVLHGEFVLDLPSRAGELPGELSFLSLEPESLVLSAVKRSEPGRFADDALIVRFYNPTAGPVSAVLRTYRPITQAWSTNLNEEPLAELPVEGENALNLPVGGKQVCTVAIRF
jgi:alpha-mannosidase